jgi:hypothetical protein
MGDALSFFGDSLLLSGIVLLGVYLAVLTFYRAVRNRWQKKQHRLPFD